MTLKAFFAKLFFGDHSIQADIPSKSRQVLCQHLQHIKPADMTKEDKVMLKWVETGVLSLSGCDYNPTFYATMVDIVAFMTAYERFDNKPRE